MAAVDDLTFSRRDRLDMLPPMLREIIQRAGLGAAKLIPQLFEIEFPDETAKLIEGLITQYVRAERSTEIFQKCFPTVTNLEPRAMKDFITMCDPNSAAARRILRDLLEYIIECHCSTTSSPTEPSPTSTTTSDSWPSSLKIAPTHIAGAPASSTSGPLPSPQLSAIGTTQTT